MLKLQNIQLIKFDPESHARIIYMWFYSGEYDEYFWMFPGLPDIQDIQKAYVDRAYMIYDHLSQSICGMIVMTPRHEASRNFETGVLIDKQFAGRKIATTALRIMLDFGFNTMNLYKSFGYVLDSNNGTKEFLKKSGGKIECVLKKHAFFDGEFRDLFIYSIFKNDFNKIYRKPHRLDVAQNVSHIKARLEPYDKAVNHE